MNTRLVTAWGLEGHAEVPVVGGAESAVVAKLNIRGAEQNAVLVKQIMLACQGHRIGGAVGPSDCLVGETPVTALAIAAVYGAIRAQNDGSASIVA